MYGIPITTFTKQANGTYGYIIELDTRQALFLDVEAVQYEVDGKMPAPVKDKQTLEEIFSQCENASCPDIAFSFNSGICHVFCKTSVLPYEETTGIILFAIREIAPLTNLDDVIDIPSEHIDLFTNYVLEEAYKIKGEIVPIDILQAISKGEKKVYETLR